MAMRRWPRTLSVLPVLALLLSLLPASAATAAAADYATAATVSAASVPAADGITNPAPACTAEGTSAGQVCNDQESIHADDDGGYLRVTAGEYFKAPYLLPH